MSESKETKQGKLVLWLRVPMVLALMVNLVLVARVPFAALQEQRSQAAVEPTAQTQPIATDDGSRPTDPTTNPANGNDGGNDPATPDDSDPIVIIDPVDVVVNSQADSKPWSPEQLNQFDQTGQWLGTALSVLNSSPDPSDVDDPQVVPLDVQPGIPLIPRLPSAVPPTPPTHDLELVLFNPKTNGGAVSFLLGEGIVTLKSGQEYRVNAGDSLRVRFHRGHGLGTADLSLTTGHFQFEVTENGWALVPLNR